MLCLFDNKYASFRDEDEEMKKYVEEELVKRTGRTAQGTSEDDGAETDQVLMLMKFNLTVHFPTIEVVHTVLSF